ncbi:MAG: GNAT family N-acetyltransferase [Terriglobia bacterium]|jgi:ribosomal protein S18 acetylase RimI-like enzyme
MMKLDQAETPEEIEEVRRLLREYEASLGVSLCFQGFERELAELPGEYAPPGGRLWMALRADQAVGCVALRRIDDETCEMKRLYLRAGFRGRGAGRLLAVAIIGEARKIGYQKMRLDTLAEMREARTLYESLGFKRIEPYYHNPMQGVIFMELKL